MEWADVPATLDSWVIKTAAPAWDIRQAGARVLTASPVGYYYHPDLEKVSIFAPLASDADLFRVKAAAARAVGKASVRDLFLTYQDIADPSGCWIKVAYSPMLRGLGESLNFFPGQYPGGMPNHPSPLAAMLTSGLVGAGLGWGGGKLLGSLLPEGYGNNLARTGLVLGGAAGAAPGAAWGLTNKATGRDFNDPTLLQGKPGQEQDEFQYPLSSMGSAAPVVPKEDSPPVSPMQSSIQDYANEMAPYTQEAKQVLRHKRGLDEVKLGALYKQACAKVAYATFGQQPAPADPSALDVNINALGQTLYDRGASPSLASTTMSAMYAAQQLPDARARAGWATYGQLGQLAENAAGDYLKGMLVGAAINTAIGTPFGASTFGAVNAGLGIIGAVVPKLFGG